MDPEADLCMKSHHIEHLFSIHQHIRSGKQSVNNPCLAAYFRWSINNKLQEFQASSKFENFPAVPNKKQDPVDAANICAQCFSPLTDFKIFNSKSQKKTRPKHKKAALKGKCNFCGTAFKMEKLFQRTPQTKKFSPKMISKRSPLNLDQTLVNSRTLTIKSNKDQKQHLQKLLLMSKKKQTLNSNSKLGEFLHSCFN